MEFFKRRSNDLFRGLGAEFAFRTQEGLSIVSGGKVLKLRMVSADEGLQRIVLIEDEYNTHILFEGSAVDVAARFVKIADQVVKPQSAVSVSRRGLYAVLAGFTAVYLVFCHPTGTTAPAAQPETADALKSILTQLPSLATGQPSFGLPGGLPSGLPTGSVSGLPATGGSPVGEANGTASAVLDRPDFLSLPEDVDAARAPAETKSDNTEAVTPAADESGIPTYSKDLYKTPSVNVDDGATGAPPAPKSVEPNKSVEPKQAEGAAVTKDPQIGNPPVAADVITPGDAELQSAQPTATPDEKAEATTAPQDPKEVAANVTKDLSRDDAAAVLKQIEDLREMDPSAITPEMLSKLPHDIAQALRDTGVLESAGTMPEKGDAPYAAIRLPAGVIDQFRGKDGIASIPENDTYAALGNRITLQLPGGGDIRKPEDLELFGFKP